MTHVFNTVFRVRHDECDAYGHVYNANYLRYMQEAGIRASEDAGYDMAFFAASDRMWLVRRTHITFLRPTRMGEELEVTTWIRNLGRVRATRAYEVRAGGDGQLVAKADTDWAFLEASTGKPARIPSELARLMAPDDVVVKGQAADAFPDLPPLAEAPFRANRQVAWGDVDPQRHLNNAVYLDYITDVAIEAGAHFGWDLDRCEAAGLAFIFSEQWIDYKQPAHFGDSLELVTWLSQMRRTTGLRHYTIRRLSDSAELAIGHSRWVCMDQATMRPVRLPDPFLADFAAHVSPWPSNRH